MSLENELGKLKNKKRKKEKESLRSKKKTN
jgi:hypothetical protein